jgi:hypothetical protein
LKLDRRAGGRKTLKYIFDNFFLIILSKCKFRNCGNDSPGQFICQLSICKLLKNGIHFSNEHLIRTLHTICLPVLARNLIRFRTQIHWSNREFSDPSLFFQNSLGLETELATISFSTCLMSHLPFIYLFIYLFIHSFVHSFVRSLIL